MTEKIIIIGCANLLVASLIYMGIHAFNGHGLHGKLFAYFTFAAAIAMGYMIYAVIMDPR